MTSADFCSSIATLLSVASPVADKQISQGKARVTLLPYTQYIYVLSVRMALGFESSCPLAHLQAALYALRVPRARSLLTASFPPHLAATQLLFG